MLFSKFIGTIYYNCCDNRNKLVSYHGWGQSKKLPKNNYSLFENAFQIKNHIIWNQ